jgi:hypothetical protein
MITHGYAKAESIVVKIIVDIAVIADPTAIVVAVIVVTIIRHAHTPMNV